MLTISQLHDYTLIHDPDDPGIIPDLVAHTGKQLAVPHQTTVPSL